MSNKSQATKSADELAEYLGLDQADTREMELKLELNNQTIDIVKRMTSLMRKLQNLLAHLERE